MVQRTLAIQSCLPRDAQKSSPAFSWNKDCRICDCYDPPAPLFTPTSPVSFGFDRIAHEASGYIAESHLSPTALERVREIIGAAKASLPSRTGLMISAKTGTDTPAVVLHQPADAPPNERNPCLRAGPLHVVLPCSGAHRRIFRPHRNSLDPASISVAAHFLAPCRVTALPTADKPVDFRGAREACRLLDPRIMSSLHAPGEWRSASKNTLIPTSRRLALVPYGRRIKDRNYEETNSHRGR